jgi:intron-binding protein aquarius
VQVLNLLYHNYPGQRALVVAHSNQALNDVFQKTIERDVPARYLLRLGMGQEDLDTSVDFSRTGARRPQLMPCRVLRSY